MDIHYINQGKRGKVGLCNICKQSASLTCIIHEPKNKEPEKLDLHPVFLGFK